MTKRLKARTQRMTIHVGSKDKDDATSPRKDRGRTGSIDTLTDEQNIAVSISIAEALLADERRYASTVLDTLLKVCIYV